MYCKNEYRIPAYFVLLPYLSLGTILYNYVHVWNMISQKLQWQIKNSAEELISIVYMQLYLIYQSYKVRINNTIISYHMRRPSYIIYNYRKYSLFNSSSLKL